MTQNASFTYAYDKAGNITSKKQYAYTTGTLGSAISTKNYTYGNSTWGDLLTSYDGHSITYDGMGNMTSYNGSTYTWNGRELAQLQGGGNTYSYTYNADGIRTGKTVNGTTTEFFLNGNQILAEKKGTTVVPYYYDSTGLRVGVVYNSHLYYYMYNLQGDVIGLARATTGQVVARYSYDAWGNCTVTNASGYTIGTRNPFRYRGYYYDDETGLYYLNSRYYSPEFGRFISADVFVSTGQGLVGSNMFAYCNNNPVTGYDPEGTWNWRKITDVVVTVVAFVVSVSAGIVSGPSPTALTTTAGVFGEINNTVNEIYYNNYSVPESSIETDPEKSTYTEGYVSRWDRLDYTRQKTKKKAYDTDARAFYSEYSAHMCAWYVAGWADGKDIPLFSYVAAHAKKADLVPNQPDERPLILIATAICQYLGI